jgi:hypothetical protein
MRIAEDHFRRVLFQTDPVTAVRTLSNDWSPRVRSEEPRFDLAVPEYNVQLCLIYSGEVGNGGHAQYFLNRGGRLVGDTTLALSSVSLERLAETLRFACQQFPLGEVPESGSAVEKLFQRLPASAFAEFDRLDRQVWNEDVDVVLLDYLRRHSEEILLPERGR